MFFLQSLFLFKSCFDLSLKIINLHIGSHIFKNEKTKFLHKFFVAQDLSCVIIGWAVIPANARISLTFTNGDFCIHRNDKPITFHTQDKSCATNTEA